MATTYQVGLQFDAQTQALDKAVSKLKGVDSVAEKLQGQLGKTGREFQTAANGMRYYIDAMGKARKENGQFVSTSEAVAAGLKKQGNEAKSAAGGIGGLSGAIGKLALAYAAIQAAKFVFAKAAEIETQTRSIQVLTGSLEQTKQIVAELQAFANVTPFTSSDIIETAKRLKAFGVETKDLVDTTKRLGDIAGATGAELSGLATAYGQVMAKGRLQGEELLQFQERGVALQEELKDMYKLSGKEFQEALEKGQISAEAVEVAVKRLTEAGGKYANGAISQSDTLAGKLSTLQDAFEQLARNIGKFFEPVFKWMLDSVTAIINRINDATVMQDEIRSRDEARQRTRNRFGARALNPFDGEVNAYRERLEKSLMQTNRSSRSALSGGIAPAPSPGTAANDLAIPALLADDKVKKAKQKSSKDLEAEQRRIDQELAKNRIALDGQIFENQQDLIRQRYELEEELTNRLAGIWANNFQGAARDQAGLINTLNKGTQEFASKVQNLQQQIDKAKQGLKAAEAGVGVAQIGARGVAGGRIGQPIEYLTGDRRSSGYRADHGGSNYHEHIAYKTAQEARAAAELLNRAGIKTTELKGVNSVGRHSQNSYHYSGQAFDVPASQVPVGQEQALSARVRQILGIGGGGAAAAGGGGVVGAMGDVETQKAALEGLNQQMQQLLASQEKFTQLGFTEFVQASTDAFKGQTASLQNQTEALQLRNRLELEGVKPELIEGELKKLEVSQQLRERTEALDEALKSNLITNEQYAKVLAEITAAAQGTASAIDQYTAAASAQQGKIAQYVNQLKGELGDTEGMIVSLAQTIEGEIGSAMSNAITGLIDGTMTAEQAFSQMFRNIGKAFIDMATQMIAKALVMKVLGILGGGAGGGSSIVPGFNVPVSSMPAGMAFADGGFVTGPTKAMIGEGGSGGEYVIPADRMGSALARYSAGARGDAVLNGSDPTGNDGGTALAEQPPQVNISGGVLTFNDTNYIKADQIPLIISQAGKAGEQRTLSRLRQSPGARRRIGLS